MLRVIILVKIVMKKHIMIYEPFDIVVVPFPFTDSSRKNDGLPWYFLKKLSLEHSLNTQYWQ